MELLILAEYLFMMNIIITPNATAHLGANAYQRTISFMFTCPQTEVNDDPVMACGHHVESPRLFWISRPELPLQISTFANSLQSSYGPIS